MAAAKGVGIATYEEMKARTLAIAKGELTPAPDDPTIWITPSVAERAEGEGRGWRQLEEVASVGQQASNASPKGTGR